jgi:hypothetical protein
MEEMWRNSSRILASHTCTRLVKEAKKEQLIKKGKRVSEQKRKNKQQQPDNKPTLNQTVHRREAPSPWPKWEQCTTPRSKM